LRLDSFDDVLVVPIDRELDLRGLAKEEEVWHQLLFLDTPLVQGEMGDNVLADPVLAAALSL
jgi:hypothetical protein